MESATAAPTAAAAPASSYTRTQYPIVLVHGAAGWGKILGVYDYWFGIIDALRSGGATVFYTQVSPFHSAEVRGEQLLSQVETIVALTGARKVNLVGHSFGGFDARYVATIRPDLVASVTTLAAPNGGAELADYIEMHFPPGSLGYNEIAAIFNLIGDSSRLSRGSHTQRCHRHTPRCGRSRHRASTASTPRLFQPGPLRRGRGEGGGHLLLLMGRYWHIHHGRAPATP